AVEGRTDPDEGGVERLDRKAGVAEPRGHLLEGLELVPRRVELLGEPADLVQGLLARGERLGVDLEPKRLARSVHRSEHFARVAAEATSIGDAGAGLVEEPGDHGDDRLLGRAPGLDEDGADLERRQRSDAAESVLDGEPGRG